MRPLRDEAFLIEVRYLVRRLRNSPWVNPERTCPVCRIKNRIEAGDRVYPTFTAMMRHWEVDHPKESPGQVTSGRDDRLTTAKTKLDFEHYVPIEIDRMTQADIDRWVRLQEKHPSECLDTLHAMGYTMLGMSTT